MSETIESLNTKISKLRSRRYKIETEKFRKKTFPQLKNKIGKAFVWRNTSYGSGYPESPETYWHIFRKLVAVELESDSLHPRLIFRECFIDSDGKATLRLNTDNVLPNLVLGGKWTDCPSEEFEKAWAATMAALVTHG